MHAPLHCSNHHHCGHRCRGSWRCHYRCHTILAPTLPYLPCLCPSVSPSPSSSSFPSLRASFPSAPSSPPPPPPPPPPPCHRHRAPPVGLLGVRKGANVRLPQRNSAAAAARTGTKARAGRPGRLGAGHSTGSDQRLVPVAVAVSVSVGCWRLGRWLGRAGARRCTSSAPSPLPCAAVANYLSDK